MFRLAAASEPFRAAVPDELVPVVWAVTMLGSAKFLMVGLSLAYWNLEAHREKLLALVSTAFLALAATLLLKYWFHLPRPPVAVQRYPVDPSPVGFPSGHALGATVVFGGLAWAVRVGPLRRRAALAAGLGSYRLLLVLAVSAFYVHTTSARESRAAVQRTVPGKPGQFLGLGVGFVFRFLPILRDDLQRVQQASRARLGDERPLHDRMRRVAVAGLNPHCGEGGLFGREEIDAIEPGVADAQAQGIDVVGPISGDTVFYRASRGEFDLVVAQYHDQGHIPLFVNSHVEGGGVGATVLILGFPFVRATTLHGTAYAIAGRGIASPESMITGITLAADAVRHGS